MDRIILDNGQIVFTEDRAVAVHLPVYDVIDVEDIEDIEDLDYYLADIELYLDIEEIA